jgi:hypothetical protein
MTYLKTLNSWQLNQVVQNIDSSDHEISLVLRDVNEGAIIETLKKTREELDKVRILIAKEQIKRDNKTNL